MRLVFLCTLFFAAGILAFALALSGLGATFNTLVFTAAASGLLFVTVNLTSAKRAAQLARDAAAETATEAGPSTNV